MRTAILALSLVCAQAHALGPYKCRPAQMFGTLPENTAKKP